MFIPAKSDRENQLERPEHYVVYGWQRSYFTHKLMAALHFYDTEWQFEAKPQANEREIRLRSGTHQVPVLHTPENWMIADTTPLLQMDAAYGDEEAAKMMIVWGGKVCRATGVSSEVQQRAAEDEYYRIMDAVASQLETTRYLLGDRPTALDCIVLAGLRAHFLYDPAPSRMLRDRYPTVVRWAEEDADAWDGSGELAPFPQSTPFARFVLSEMKQTWVPFALGNRAALAAGEKAFVIPMYGEDVSYLARPYVERSAQMLAAHVSRQRASTNHIDTWLTAWHLKAAIGQA